jgi:rhodanese-related sulfurtransferase
MPKTLKDFVTAAKQGCKEISAEEAAKRRESTAATLMLDVREPAELATTGRIPGAVHVPRGLLEPKADLEYPQREPKLADREQPVIVYCASGARSAMAAVVLQEMGFTNVCSLAGGFTAWAEKGLPIEKS